MKKSIYIIVLLVGSSLFNVAKAQSRVCIWCGYNIDVQPKWGPVGYDYVDYYYMPDIETYYNVSQHKFISQKKGVWVTTSTLPARFGTFDLYKAHKVVLNEEEPYLRHENYKGDYAPYKGQNDQAAIRDSHDPKYLIIKEHPEHIVAEAKGETRDQRKDKGHDQSKVETNRTIAER